VRNRLELYVSQTRIVGLLALTCAMVGVSYFCTTLPGLKPRIFGWLGVGFFGLGFIILPRQLMKTGVQFVIDERGLHDHRSKFGLVEWNDVTALSLGTIRGQRFLCVHMREPEKYLSRLSKAGRLVAQANEGLGFPPITLAFSGLSKSKEEVLQFIQDNYAPVVS
jgi:hypothetical protein